MKIDRNLYNEFLGCLGLTDGNAGQQNLLRQIILNPYDCADAWEIVGKFLADTVWQNPTEETLYSAFGDDEDPENPHYKFVNNIPLTAEDKQDLKNVIKTLIYEDDCNYAGTIIYDLECEDERVFLFTEHLGDSRSDDQTLTPKGVYLTIDDGMEALYRDGSF